MDENDEFSDPELEQRLRRHYERRYEEADQPAALWSQLQGKLEPRQASSQGAAGRRGVRVEGSHARGAGWKRSLMPLAGTLLLVLVAVGAGLLSGQLAGFFPQQSKAPLADALDGAVAMREKAAQPGLYLYGKNGWQWLENSDLGSRLRARCANGDLIYDVDAAAQPEPTAAMPARDPRLSSLGVNEALLGRRYVRSSPGGKIRETLPFNPGQWSRTTCGAEGVIASNFLGGIHTPGGYNHIYYAVASQRSGNSSMNMPSLPADNWFVVAVSPAADSILLVEAPVDQMQDPTIDLPADWYARLYAAEPDGTNRRLLADRTDVPHSMFGGFTYSPDGRYVAATFFDPRQSPMAVTSLLIDTQGNQPGVLREFTGTQESRATSGPVGPDVPPINPPDAAILTTFLTEGPRAGQLAVLTSQNNRQNIRVYDPAAPDQPLIDVSTNSDFAHWVTPASSRDNKGMLFSWYTADRRATLVYIDPEGGHREAGFTPIENRVVQSTMLRSDYLLYQLRPFSFVPGDSPENQVIAVPLANFDPGTTLPVSLAGSNPADPTATDLGQIWYGAERYAYVTPAGDLHLRNYDGNGDVLVEQGVAGFSLLAGEALY